MHTVDELMQIRSDLVKILNNSGLTIDTALLLVKDIYNELYIASLQAQINNGIMNGLSSTSEKVETIREEDIKLEQKEEN